MRNTILLAGALASILAAAPLSAHAMQSSDQQQVKLAKGTWWGKVGDVIEMEFKDGLAVKKIVGTVTKIDKGIITVDGVFDGRRTTRPIFASEIQSIKPAEAPATAPGEQPAGTGTDKSTGTDKGSSGSKPASKPDDSNDRMVSRPLGPGGKVGIADEPVRGGTKLNKQVGDGKLHISEGIDSGRVDAQGYKLDDKGYRISDKKGVFVLPFRETVGKTARAFEILQLAKEADLWGPGQIIVLDIDSPGGLVSEIYRISAAIKEVRKRHRVVAWIRKAISAASATAVHCDEIYFRTVGSLGACMMIQGLDPANPAAVQRFIRDMDEVVADAGRPPMIFRAMVYAAPILTYTKDSVTGKVTFHDKITGLPGEIVLSDDKDNLVFNAGNALDCGFSQGTADSGEELAKLLGLPEWYEISDYGRKIGDAWYKLCHQCDDELPILAAKLRIPKAGGTIEQIQSSIQIYEAVQRWTQRCAPCTELAGIDPVAIEQGLRDLRRQLVDLRKAQQRSKTS